jgi:hypothetical protein
VVQSVVTNNNGVVSAGADTVVNTTAAGHQSPPIMVGTANGGYFTVWVDNVLNDPMGQIRGQQFDANGIKVGAEIAIGTSQPEGTVGKTNMPHVSAVALSNGNVVVEWMSNNGAVVGGVTDPVIQSVITNNNGTMTAGPETVVNTSTGSHQSGTVMVALPDGGYFSSWYTKEYDDPSGNVRGQRFDANGAKIGSELTLGTAVVEGDRSTEMPHLHAAVLENGNVVVSWQAEGSLNIDGNSNAVVQVTVNPLNIKPVTAPVVLDLNGDGQIGYSHVTMDVNGDGVLDNTAWTDAHDGVLVWDKLGDGVVHDNSQYAFSQYGGNTDLEGLAAAFDTNRDGKFDSLDAQFKEFAVWQDANQNGVSDAGEVRSLTELGLVEINLTSDGVQRQPADGVVEAGRTSATLSDGTAVLVADASFAYTEDFRALCLL